MRPKIQRLFWSNGNLAGLAVASIVLVLHVFDILDPKYWWLIAVLGYATGWFLMPRPSLVEQPDLYSTEEALVWLETQTEKLRGEPKALLKSIVDEGRQILPKLKQMELDGVVLVDSRVKIKMVITDYLPNVLHSFLKLPVLYALNAKTQAGKTPQVLLIEQLKLLEGQMQEIKQGLYQQNINEILLQSAFLESKFKESKAQFDEN